MTSGEYLHAPFLGPAVYLEALRLLEPKPKPRGSVDARAPAESARGGGSRPGGRLSPRLVDGAGFIDVERDVWIEAGIRRHNAHIAEQCVGFG